MPRAGLGLRWVNPSSQPAKWGWSTATTYLYLAYVARKFQSMYVNSQVSLVTGSRPDNSGTCIDPFHQQSFSEFQH